MLEYPFWKAWQRYLVVMFPGFLIVTTTALVLTWTWISGANENVLVAMLSALCWLAVVVILHRLIKDIIALQKNVSIDPDRKIVRVYGPMDVSIEWHLDQFSSVCSHVIFGRFGFQFASVFLHGKYDVVEVARFSNFDRLLSDMSDHEDAKALREAISGEFGLEEKGVVCCAW